MYLSEYECDSCENDFIIESSTEAEYCPACAGNLENLPESKHRGKCGSRKGEHECGCGEEFYVESSEHVKYCPTCCDDITEAPEPLYSDDELEMEE